jgi:N-acetylglucosamine-6-phosphate deacetylase
MLIIKNAKVFNGEKMLDSMNIYISGSKINKLEKGEISEAPSDAQVVDLNGKLVTPGFIDIHMHGAGGYDVMDATEESIELIASILAMHGTTSFLPSTVTMPVESISKCISVIGKCIKSKKSRNILGVHLEGPFINRRKKGAQNEEHILAPSISAYENIVGEGHDIIKRVTLAPELDKDNSLTKYLKDKGICVSAGHTCASIEQFTESVKSGVRLCTHLFNCMDTLHHRDPGVVGGGLTNEGVYVEFIPDLLHLNKDILKLIVLAKGEDKCIIITDSLCATCLKKGIYRLGDQHVIVTENGARLKNGALAGSIIMMAEAVRNMINEVGIDPVKVLKMATLNPAKVLGVENYLGRIAEGYDADMNILDWDFNVERTILKGRCL